jgi:hypothetical protein
MSLRNDNDDLTILALMDVKWDCLYSGDPARV